MLKPDSPHFHLSQCTIFLYSTYIVFNPSNCKMGVWGETHLIVVKNSTCTLVRKGGNRDFNDIGKKISIQIKMNKKIAPL